MATGRSKFEIASEHLLDGLQFDGYLTNNGQDAYDASGNLIYGKPIDPRDAESLLNWAEKKGCTFWMVSAEKTCINHPSEAFLQAMHALHTAPPPAGDLREMLRRPVYKIVLFLSREEIAASPCAALPLDPVVRAGTRYHLSGWRQGKCHA